VDITLLLEYSWILLVLIVMEGILAADNACVIAVMVKHLSVEDRKKALFYGLGGAFVFRVASLFIISLLIDMWQIQAIGAAYLIFLSANHLLKKHASQECSADSAVKKANSGLWMTVCKVEIADIAFAADSILAAVALAMTLPNTGMPTIGGLDGGKFAVIFTGGFIGVVMMRFAAQWFCDLLIRKPGLETTAYAIVGWVGVKLAIYTVGHPEVNILSTSFAHGEVWKMSFWVVFIAICASGWYMSEDKSQPET
jgi:YkoY family integral membrane protein